MSEIAVETDTVDVLPQDAQCTCATDVDDDVDELTGEDTTELDRSEVPEGSRFDDEQWATFTALCQSAGGEG